MPKHGVYITLGSSKFGICGQCHDAATVWPDVCVRIFSDNAWWDGHDVPLKPLCHTCVDNLILVMAGIAREKNAQDGISRILSVDGEEAIP